MTGTSRASSRGLSQRTVPIPTATASDCARSTWTSLRDASPVTQRSPGMRTRPSSVDRDLVRDERPSARHPRSPLLDLLTAAERELAVGELDLDTRGAQLLETAAVLRSRIELARDDACDARQRGARRRTAASHRGARRARASRRPSRRAHARRPPRERRPRRAGRPSARASPRRRPRRRTTTTAPTIGFGCVVPRPLSASSSARSRNRSSSTRRSYGAAVRSLRCAFPSRTRKRLVVTSGNGSRRCRGSSRSAQGGGALELEDADRHAALARRSRRRPFSS